VAAAGAGEDRSQENVMDIIRDYPAMAAAIRNDQSLDFDTKRLRALSVVEGLVAVDPRLNRRNFVASALGLGHYVDGAQQHVPTDDPEWFVQPERPTSMTEIQAAFDTYVELWHQLNVLNLSRNHSISLTRDFDLASQEIRRLTGKRPGDFPEVMARIGN
jgi:hypothetical protein